MIASGRPVVAAGFVANHQIPTFGRSNIASLPPYIFPGCFAETVTLTATGSVTRNPLVIGKMAVDLGFTPTTLESAPVPSGVVRTDSLNRR